MSISYNHPRGRIEGRNTGDGANASNMGMGGNVCCRSEMRRHPAHVLARAQNVTTLQTSFQRDVRLSDLDIGYALDFFACHISAPAASTLTLLFRGYPSALFPIRHLHPVVLSIATSKGFPHINLACFTLPSTQFRLSQRHNLAPKQSTFTRYWGILSCRPLYELGLLFRPGSCARPDQILRRAPRRLALRDLLPTSSSTASPFSSNSSARISAGLILLVLRVLCIDQVNCFRWYVVERARDGCDAFSATTICQRSAIWTAATLSIWTAASTAARIRTVSVRSGLPAKRSTP